MGYVTDAKGRLVCDACGNTGARKRPCPVRYCPANALCALCNAAVRADGRWAKAHADCPRLSAEYHAQKAREAAEPHYYPASAWGDWADDVPTGMVKVLTRADTVVYMPTEVYRGRIDNRLPDQWTVTYTPTEGGS